VGSVGEPGRHGKEGVEQGGGAEGRFVLVFDSSRGRMDAANPVATETAVLGFELRKRSNRNSCA
jgi:hypothetical protein